MARNQKDATYDHAHLLKDAGAVNTSGNGTVASAARVVDLGNGRSDFRALVDATVITAADASARYELVVQGSTTADFSAGNIALATLPLGGATGTGNSAATPAGRYEVHGSNEQNGVRYRYVRIRHVISGTVGAGINYSAYLVKSS